MNRIGQALAAAAVFSFNVSVAIAGSQVARSLEQLVADSQTIVLGEPIAARSAWEDGSLVTRYTVRVAETLKGTHESQIVVTVPGGVDMNRRVPIARIVPGAPQLVANQQVLLMLQRPTGAQTDDYSILGLNQGVMSAPSAAAAPASPTSRSARGKAAAAGADAFDRVRQRIRDIQNRQRN